MPMVRVIPCLDVKDGRVVKGVSFEGLRDVGDPVEAARRYDAESADELVFLDVSASLEGRKTMREVVSRVAEQVFIPLTVGGGVSTVDDVGALLHAGADKVGMNSAAVSDPELITRAAERYGSQCVVVAVDAKRDGARYVVHTHGGKRATTLDAVEWCAEAARRGAGELLLTSIDADGTQAGYDLELLRAVRARVRVPVVASGGAGKASHFVDAVRAGADAVLAASLFHDRKLAIEVVKDTLAEAGIAVRRAPRVLETAGARVTQGTAVLVHGATGEVLGVERVDEARLADVRARGVIVQGGRALSVLSLAHQVEVGVVLVRVEGPPAGDLPVDAALGAPWSGSSLAALDVTLAQRARERPPKSYTVELLDHENKRLKKLGEELVELVRALDRGDRSDMIAEAADLMFHIGVALKAEGVVWSEVLEELRRRRI